MDAFTAAQLCKTLLQWSQGKISSEDTRAKRTERDACRWLRRCPRPLGLIREGQGIVDVSRVLPDPIHSCQDFAPQQRLGTVQLLPNHCYAVFGLPGEQSRNVRNRPGGGGGGASAFTAASESVTSMRGRHRKIKEKRVMA